MVPTMNSTATLGTRDILGGGGCWGQREVKGHQRRAKVKDKLRSLWALQGKGTAIWKSLGTTPLTRLIFFLLIRNSIHSVFWLDDTVWLNYFHVAASRYQRDRVNNPSQWLYVFSTSLVFFFQSHAYLCYSDQPQCTKSQVCKLEQIRYKTSFNKNVHDAKL